MAKSVLRRAAYPGRQLPEGSRVLADARGREVLPPKEVRASATQAPRSVDDPGLAALAVISPLTADLYLRSAARTGGWMDGW